MGGQAFLHVGAASNPPFTTPRIPPPVYEQLKKDAVAVASNHFARVAPMPDAPGKLDYGDVDLVVESALSETAIQDLSKALNAIHTINNPPDYHFAIPRPDALPSSFAQLDILVCSPGYLDWTLFLHGYGDLGQILGVMNHDYGFTANDKGFNVRIKEQEAKNWRASQVLLTKEPEKVMDFLHLNKDEYLNGFDSEEELFRWVSKSRFLNRKSIETRKDDSDNRQRMQKRPMFRRFVSEYLPSLPNTKSLTPDTRDSFLKEALIFFDKEEEFASRRNSVLVESAEDHAWSSIATTVLAPVAGLRKDKLNEVVRAFKRFTVFRADGPYIRNNPEMDTQNQARFAVTIDDAGNVKPEMRKWILDHWQHIKSLERQRVKDRKRAAMRDG